MAWLSEHAGMIGLIFFLVFFVAMVGWVFRPGSKADYQSKSLIPLREDR
jgi:cbb3-type cytochrome oxidase subunit 3